MFTITKYKLRKTKVALGSVALLGVLMAFSDAKTVSANEITQPSSPNVVLVNSAKEEIESFQDETILEVVEQQSETIDITNVEYLEDAPLIFESSEIIDKVTPEQNLTENGTVTETGVVNETSKWSIVNYRVDDTQTRNSDKIVIDNLYTKPARYASSVSSEETTELEHQQYWERWLLYGNSYSKVVASDLDPSNTTLRNVTKLNDDTVFYNNVIRANYADVWYVLSNAYASNQTKNLVDIFGYNYKISDQQFAQLKAAKMRSDIAYNYLIENSPTDVAIGTYKELSTYYNRIETIFNAYHNPDYAPNILIDESSEGFTNEEKRELESVIQKLPLPIRQLIVDVRIVSDENSDIEKFHAILGSAGNTRQIKLNSKYNGLTGTLFHEIGHIVDYMSAEYENQKFITSLSHTPEFHAIWKTAFAKDTPYFRDRDAEAFADGFGNWLEVRYFGKDASVVESRRPGVLAYFDKLGEQLFGLNSHAMTGGGRLLSSKASNDTDSSDKKPDEKTSQDNNSNTETSEKTTNSSPDKETEKDNESKETPINPQTPEVSEPIYEADENLEYGIRTVKVVNGQVVTVIGTKPVTTKTYKIGKKSFYYIYTFTVDPKTGKTVKTSKRIEVPIKP